MMRLILAFIAAFTAGMPSGAAQEKLRTDGLYVWDNKIYELHFLKQGNVVEIANRQSAQLGLDKARTDSLPACFPKGKIPILNRGAYFHLIGFFSAASGQGTTNTCRSSQTYRAAMARYEATAKGRRPVVRSKEHDLTHLQADPLSGKIYFEIGTHPVFRETYEGYLKNGDLLVNVEHPFLRSYNKDYKKKSPIYGMRRYKFYPYGTLPPGLDHPMKWIFDEETGEASQPARPNRR